MFLGEQVCHYESNSVTLASVQSCSDLHLLHILQLKGLLTASQLAKTEKKIVKRTENMSLTFTQKDRRALPICVMCQDYPTDPRKKWDVPKIHWQIKDKAVSTHVDCVKKQFDTFSTREEEMFNKWD